MPKSSYVVRLSKQWAAVRTHFGLMRVPPQLRTNIAGDQKEQKLTRPAQAPCPGRTSVPPTTRDEPSAVGMGRSPQVSL